jgi:hypothetical protein
MFFPTDTLDAIESGAVTLAFRRTQLLQLIADHPTVRAPDLAQRRRLGASEPQAPHPRPQGTRSDRKPHHPGPRQSRGVFGTAHIDNAYAPPAAVTA